MMKTINPLFDTDVTRYFGQFSVPTLDVEALVNAQRKNFEAFQAANQVAIEGAGEIVRRQGELARESVEAYASAVKEILAGSSVEEKAAKQAEIAKRSYDRSVANARELADIVTKAGNETFAVLNERFREGLVEVQDLVANGAPRAGAAAPQEAAQTAVAKTAGGRK